jgi:hypothetical protein
MLRQMNPREPAGARPPLGPPGVVLVLAILLVGLLMVMGMTMLNLASSDHQIAGNESKSIQALYNADAGTEEAKMRLNPSAPVANQIPIGVAPNWRAYISTDSDAATATQTTLKARIAALDPTYVSANAADYTVYPSIQTANVIQWGWCRIEKKRDASNNLVYMNVLTGVETTTASATDAAGVTYNNLPVLVVTSEGIQQNVRRMIAMELRPIIATTTTNTTITVDPFAMSAHGKNSISVDGNVATDSYDSRKGAYGGTNKGANGDISTDATGPGVVAEIGPNATINGDLMVGPGANLASAVQNKGTVNGTTGTEPALTPMPLSTIPAGVKNSGAISLSGKATMTLTSGTYWFSSINISGNGQLTISGNVKIYVTGPVDAGGNGIVNAAAPTNLFIYGTQDPTNAANVCNSVSIHGNGNFSGAVYAPEADITMVGNGETYGALSGKSVKFTGSGMGGFHYDEALGNLGSFVTGGLTTNYSTSGYTRFSWREIPF